MIRRTLALIFFALVASAVGAQPTPTTAAETATAAIDADSRQTREEMKSLLRRYPPELGYVLKLDPTLFGNHTYLATYPALANFVAQRVQYGNGPYGHNLGGTPASLVKISRDDIVKFHSTWYRPDNAVLVVAGDVKPDDVFALAQKLFASWKASGPMPPRSSASSEAAPPRVVSQSRPSMRVATPRAPAGSRSEAAASSVPCALAAW